MNNKICLALVSLMTIGAFSSCNRSTHEIWEDTKTCGRYMNKGIHSLRGQHIDSREYASFFDVWEDEQEFIAITDAENSGQDLRPSKESPGDPGSGVPGIDGFHAPTGRLASLFTNIKFETDNYSIKAEHIPTLKEIADYLDKHPNLYVFIEGHADERGAAAYNLALGSRRANAVRNFLVQNGVNPDQLFAISYGLERPVSLGHDDVAWQQNRRAQFKTYEK